jgi:hypothetical protein
MAGSMASRFVSNILVLLAGAALVPFTLSFSPATASWVGLGVGCFVVVTTLVAFPVRGRGNGQRRLDALIALLGVWTIVASRVFDGTTLKWLTLGSGCAFAALAIGGLVVHEVRMELAVRYMQRQAGDGRVSRMPERPPIGVAS